MFEISLSHMPQLNGKMSPFFIMTDDDIELFLDSRNNKIYKSLLKVTILPKGVTVNDEIGEDSDDDSDNEGEDGGDFCSHDGRGEMHNSFFDIDFLKTNQIEVGTSRKMLLVYHNMELVDVEFQRGASISAKGVSQPAEGDSQLPKCANQPSEPLLLLTTPISGEPLNKPRNEPSNSIFRNGSDLHKGRYFSCKK